MNSIAPSSEYFGIPRLRQKNKHMLTLRGLKDRLVGISHRISLLPRRVFERFRAGDSYPVPRRPSGRRSRTQLVLSNGGPHARKKKSLTMLLVDRCGSGNSV